MAEVFYRKWRPQKLSDVVGQQTITRTLKQAVAQGRTSHAYLFSGSRGTGKTSTARILAKAMNCVSPQDGEPDNQCSMCIAINDGRALDLIEIDAASNRGIDDIRDLSDKIRFSPNEGRYKVYIIDEVHMLTDPAFNALLKTLEEPPAHVLFVLATTEVHKVPLTIISRCQRFDFKRITRNDIASKLADISSTEGIIIDDASLQLVAELANGSLRDAENLLEQVVVSHESPISEANVRDMLGLGHEQTSIRLVCHVLERSAKEGIIVINEFLSNGGDLHQLHRGFMEYLRVALLLKTGAKSDSEYSRETLEKLSAISQISQLEHLIQVSKIFGEIDLRMDSSSPLTLEVAVVESCLVEESYTQNALAPKLSISNVVSPVGSEPPTVSDDKVKVSLRENASTTVSERRSISEEISENDEVEISHPEEIHESGGKADLDRKWDEIIADLRMVGKKYKIGALLRNIREREVSDDIIDLKFTHGSHLDRMNQELENPESNRTFNEVIKGAIPGSHKIVLGVAGDNEGTRFKRASQDSHLVRYAQSMGARVVTDKEINSQ